jgi:hypothetical protein
MEFPEIITRLPKAAIPFRSSAWSFVASLN